MYRNNKSTKYVPLGQIFSSFNFFTCFISTGVRSEKRLYQ
jgi:hypothetical protein